MASVVDICVGNLYQARQQMLAAYEKLAIYAEVNNGIVPDRYVLRAMENCRDLYVLIEAQIMTEEKNEHKTR